MPVRILPKFLGDAAIAEKAQRDAEPIVPLLNALLPRLLATLRDGSLPSLFNDEAGVNTDESQGVAWMATMIEPNPPEISLIRFRRKPDQSTGFFTIVGHHGMAYVELDAEEAAREASIGLDDLYDLQTALIILCKASDDRK